MTDIPLPLDVPERLELGEWFAASGVDPNGQDCVWFEVAAADVAADLRIQETWLSWPDQWQAEYGARMAYEIDIAVQGGQLAEEGPLSDDEMFALQAIQHAGALVEEVLSQQLGEYMNLAG